MIVWADYFNDLGVMPLLLTYTLIMFSICGNVPSDGYSVGLLIPIYLILLDILAYRIFRLRFIYSLIINSSKCRWI